MSTIFDKIIKKELPAEIIVEQQHMIALLDVRPVYPGHTLVLPKTGVDHFFELAPTTLSSLILFAQKIAHLLKCKLKISRVGMVVEGFEVPHAHIHLLPLARGHTASLNGSRPRVSRKELAMMGNFLRNTSPEK